MIEVGSRRSEVIFIFTMGLAKKTKIVYKDVKNYLSISIINKKYLRRVLNGTQY